MAKILQSDIYEKALNLIGKGHLLFIVALIFSLIMIPLGAAIVKLIIRIFGKRLTIKKFINIYGYILTLKITAAQIARPLWFTYCWAFMCKISYPRLLV